MGKDRKAHEVVEELMVTYNVDVKGLAEKTGVSELVVLNYFSGLNKDSRNYVRFKGMVKKAFGLDEEFFGEGHVWEPVAITLPEKKEEKPAKPKKPRKKAETAQKKETSDEGIQLSFDEKGQISQTEPEKPEGKDTEVKVTEVKKPESRKTPVQQDGLMSAIRMSGSKAKLAGKKKDITPEDAVRWAEEYSEEIKQSIGRAFGVLSESLKDNFKKEDPNPVFANKKIAEIVELASKAKEDDLNLIIAMLKKITR